MDRNRKSKTIFDERYERLIADLIVARKKKGLTQLAFSEKSGFDTCFVGRVETRERRLDVLELVDWLRALGFSNKRILTLIKETIVDIID